MAYALIPWIGVTAVGYGLGQVYRWEAERRRRLLLRLGLALVAAFLVLRTINVYGDPVPWSAQKSPMFTVLSFLNTTKYPPSLLFLLMTLGPILLLLRALDAATARAASSRAGVRQGAAVLLPAARAADSPRWRSSSATRATATAHWMFQSNRLDQFPVTQPPGWAIGLPWVYLIWAGVVIALYPVCRWFAALKRRRGMTGGSAIFDWAAARLGRPR